MLIPARRMCNTLTTVARPLAWMFVTATHFAGLPGFEVRAVAPHTALLIVHGLAEYADRYRSHALDLAERGISTYAFDQRGHGAVPGPRTHVEHFQQFVDDLQRLVVEVQAREPSLPLYVWGHSMGSMVLAAAARALPIRGAIFSSCSLEVFRDGPNPLHPVFRFLARIVPRVRVPLFLDASKISSDPEVQRAYGNDPRIPGTASLRLVVEFAAACEQVRAAAPSLQLPCLVLHGELDAIAPVTGGQQFFDALGSTDKQLEIFAGQRHEVHNESSPARQRFLDTLATWIQQHV
jgi:alpha-beta hydrolase superfamily lysophospholipase